MNNSYRILIVEDEILIADTIKRYLQSKGHKVVGIAISYEEAIELYQNENPDIVLLDIRINGSKTGIDVAHFIQEQIKKKPFIYLTSQLDSKSINSAKETFPAGYLSKPLHKEGLLAAIEIAIHSFQSKQKEAKHITLYDGSANHVIAINEILYLETDHIYISIYLVGDRKIVMRNSMKEMIELLPAEDFLQTHRSFAINKNKVSHWDNQFIYVKEKAIPMSRSRRKIVLSQMNSN